MDLYCRSMVLAVHCSTPGTGYLPASALSQTLKGPPHGLTVCHSLAHNGLDPCAAIKRIIIIKNMKGEKTPSVFVKGVKEP